MNDNWDEFHAVRLAKLARGVMEYHPDAGGGCAVEELRTLGLVIRYRAPFQSGAGEPRDSNGSPAVSRLRSPAYSYQIDIWSSRKVLSVGWNLNGKMRVALFQQGDWEKRLEMLAGEIKTRKRR